MPFGIGLVWLSSSNKVTNGDDTLEEDDSFSNFQIQAGLTPSQLFQLALEIGFGSFEDNDDGTLQSKGSTTNFALTSRGDIDNFAGFAWRYLAGFSYGVISPDGDGAEDITDMGFRASFGPVFGTPGQWEVAGYITLDYQSFEALPNKSTSFTFPGYNLAGEYYLNSWFVFRAGVLAMYSAVTDEDESATGTDDKKDEYTEYTYAWTMGVGIDKGAWGLDFALEEEPVHSGYLLSDVNQDVFAYITGWFRW